MATLEWAQFCKDGEVGWFQDGEGSAQKGRDLVYVGLQIRVWSFDVVDRDAVMLCRYIR